MLRVSLCPTMAAASLVDRCAFTRSTECLVGISHFALILQLWCRYFGSNTRALSRGLCHSILGSVYYLLFGL